MKIPWHLQGVCIVYFSQKVQLGTVKKDSLPIFVDHNTPLQSIQGLVYDPETNFVVVEHANLLMQSKKCCELRLLSSKSGKVFCLFQFHLVGVVQSGINPLLFVYLGFHEGCTGNSASFDLLQSLFW